MTEQGHLRDKAERAMFLLRQSARVSPILRDAVEDVSQYVRSIEAENAASSAGRAGPMSEPRRETRPLLRCTTCGAVNPPGVEFRAAVGASYHPSPSSERALPCGPVVDGSGSSEPGTPLETRERNA